MEFKFSGSQSVSADRVALKNQELLPLSCLGFISIFNPKICISENNFENFLLHCLKVYDVIVVEVKVLVLKEYPKKNQELLPPSHNFVLPGIYFIFSPKIWVFASRFKFLQDEGVSRRECFKYIVSIVRKDVKIAKDVTRRIQVGCIKWRSGSRMLCDCDHRISAS